MMGRTRICRAMSPFATPTCSFMIPPPGRPSDPSPPPPFPVIRISLAAASPARPSSVGDPSPPPLVCPTSSSDPHPPSSSHFAHPFPRPQEDLERRGLFSKVDGGGRAGGTAGGGAGTGLRPTFGGGYFGGMEEGGGEDLREGYVLPANLAIGLRSPCGAIVNNGEGGRRTP